MNIHEETLSVVTAAGAASGSATTTNQIKGRLTSIHADAPDDADVTDYVITLVGVRDEFTYHTTVSWNDNIKSKEIDIETALPFQKYTVTITPDIDPAAEWTVPVTLIVENL